MGDGNMHWSTAFVRLPGVQTSGTSHATVAAATAYNVVTM
jgi:acetolactate synthase I/II/III large subunit